MKTSANVATRATKKGQMVPILFQKLALAKSVAVHIITVVNAYKKAAKAVKRKILLRIDFLLNEYTVTPRNKQLILANNESKATVSIANYPYG